MVPLLYRIFYFFMSPFMMSISYPLSLLSLLYVIYFLFIYAFLFIFSFYRSVLNFFGWRRANLNKYMRKIIDVYSNILLIVELEFFRKNAFIQLIFGSSFFTFLRLNYVIYYYYFIIFITYFCLFIFLYILVNEVIFGSLLYYTFYSVILLFVDKFFLFIFDRLITVTEVIVIDFFKHSICKTQRLVVSTFPYSYVYSKNNSYYYLQKIYTTERKPSIYSLFVYSVYLSDTYLFIDFVNMQHRCLYSLKKGRKSLFLHSLLVSCIRSFVIVLLICFVLFVNLGI